MLFFLLKPPIVCSDYYIFLTKINQSNKFKHFLKIPCSAPFKVKALKMIKGKYPHTGRIEDGGLFSLICFCMHMYNITDNKLEHCETVTSITANDTDYIPQLFFFFFLVFAQTSLLDHLQSLYLSKNTQPSSCYW